jgi:hypothetical protein
MAKYVLITWKDGYQEVGSADEATTGILRYYVIERVEKSGRLSFQSAADCPGLKIIGRKPDEIESIVLTEDSQEKAFTLNLKEDKSEGGRTDHHYKIKEADDEVIDSLVDKVQKVAKDLGISPKSAKEEDLEKIRKAVRLSCFETQSEVLGFIKWLLERAQQKS